MWNDGLTTEDAYDEAAHSLYEAGEYDEAIKVLTEGLAVYPASAELQIGTGFTRLAREEFPWAAKAFRAAVALDPTSLDGWVGLAEALAALGKDDEAVAALMTAWELSAPADLDIGLEIARGFFFLGRIDVAEDVARRLHGTHPDNPNVLCLLAQAAIEGLDLERADGLLATALESAPDHVDARIMAADVAFYQDDTPRALRLYLSVPPRAHNGWGSVQRTLSLLEAEPEPDPAALAIWRTRFEALNPEPDAIDAVLAEVAERFAPPLFDEPFR